MKLANATRSGEACAVEVAEVVLGVLQDPRRSLVEAGARLLR